MPAAKVTDWFVQVPTELPELDHWVAERLHSQNRFTFEEAEVLGDLWRQGQEIRLREDSRFVPIEARYWRFRQHKVANVELYNLLLDELWDGSDLVNKLAELDTATIFHIFCPQDDYLTITAMPQGYYTLSLSNSTPLTEPTTGQKEALERVSSGWLQISQLYTTNEMLVELKKLSLSSLPDLPTIENWLIKQPEWQRVSLDQWLPRQYLPTLSLKTARYAVLPVSNTASLLMTSSKVFAMDTSSEEAKSDDVSVKFTSNTDSSSPLTALPTSVTWHTTLRTYHLNEGILSVPSSARTLYPHVRKLSNLIALPSLWYEDNTVLIVWLDRNHHKLFGPDLQARLELLAAGVVLQVTWTQHNLLFSQVGEDTQVAEEEARLIDVASLAEVRTTQLESYRSSLRLLLTNNPQSFTTLYQQLCIRQQHTVNQNTVRSILSASPEFLFESTTKCWQLDPNISNEQAARRLRQIGVITERTEMLGNQKSVNLKELLSTNYAHLKDFETDFGVRLDFI